MYLLNFKYHYIIYFDINFTHSSSNVIQSVTKLNYSSADYQGTTSDFFSTNLYSLSVFDSNSLWTLIKNIIYTACDIYVTKFKIPSHSSPKYFTSEIRHNIKCIHSKKRLLKRHYSSSLAHKVQIMESELQQRIKNAQITYINSLISSFSSKPRSLYSHLSHLKRSSSLPCILKHEDKTTSDPLGKAIFLTTILIQSLLAVILFFHLAMHCLPTLHHNLAPYSFLLVKFLMYWTL